MASVQVQRPPPPSSTNSTTTPTQPKPQRQSSLSSFPPSRSPSTLSRPSRSPATPLIPRDYSPSVSSRVLKPYSSSRMGRPLRSQYPANSRENHVEYILVASFDIDRGSIMEHQYPGPISGDEHMLADLMLPDQAHVRSQDWTIFFLHKDTEAEEEAKEERRERRRLRKERNERKAANGEADGENGATAEEEMEEDDDDIDSDESESSDEEGFEGPPLIYVLNLVNTKQDNTVKRYVLVTLDVADID